MHKVTVPTCHIEKLKALGIYDQWLSNIKSYLEREHRDARCFSGDSWTHFIAGSFNWLETTEGLDYWGKIENS